MLRLDYLTTGADNVELGTDTTSLHWENDNAKLCLSCLPFELDQYPGQSFWSYTIHIALNAPDHTVDTDEILLNARNTAQVFSDQRVLPSEWDFAQETQIIWTRSTRSQDTIR